LEFVKDRDPDRPFEEVMEMFTFSSSKYGVDTKSFDYEAAPPSDPSSAHSTNLHDFVLN